MTERAFDLNAAFDDAATRSRHLDAEQAVIGGCLNKPDILGWLELDAAAFFDPRHQAVWGAMQDLLGARVAIDLVTVSARLREDGRFEAIGGEAYLLQLELRCPSTDNIEHYAGVLIENLVNRRVLQIAGAVPSLIRDGDVGADLLSVLQSQLLGAEPSARDTAIDITAAVRKEYEQILVDWEKRAKTGSVDVGVPTGIQRLDADTGGLIIGAPTILGARPGKGKSTLCLNLANHAARLGYGVHVFTYEDGTRTFAQRQLSFWAGVDVSRIRVRDLDRHEVNLLRAAAEEHHERRPPIALELAHGMPVQTLVRRVRGRRRELKTRLVIVDYLQLIPPPDRRMKRVEFVEENMHGLTDLAGKEDLAVLVVSQLSRECEKEGRRPRKSDFRDSGAIEQDGKLMLALHDPGDKNLLEILILKNHQGPGETVIPVHYDRARARISGLSTREEP